MSTKQIFVVTAGDYSSYRIEGVFSTKEKANVFLDFYNKGQSDYSKASIEEYDLDGDADKIAQGLQLFALMMSYQGEVLKSSPSSDKSADKPILVPKTGYGGVLYGTIWAKDINHAAKIFNEQRVTMIAENRWADASPYIKEHSKK